MRATASPIKQFSSGRKGRGAGAHNEAAGPTSELGGAPEMTDRGRQSRLPEVEDEDDGVAGQLLRSISLARSKESTLAHRLDMRVQLGGGRWPRQR